MKASTVISKITMSAALVIAGVLSSTTPALSADFKVGFVNVARVLEKAPQATEARGRIEREFAPKDRKLLSQQKKIRGLEDKLVRDGAVMSERERVRLDQEIRSMKREVRRLQEEFREDLNLRRNQELGKLQRKVIETIQSLAKADDYDLIVSDGVLYAGSRVDITTKVISRLKVEFDGSPKSRGSKK
jgi:outer membrane protein